MVKLFGAALVVVTGALLGWQKASRARQRVCVLRQLEQLMARIQGEIYYRGTPQTELLHRLCQEDAYPQLELNRCDKLYQFRMPPILTSAEREGLQGFFSGLGRTTSEESKRQGAYYQKQCAEYLEQAVIQSRTAEDLYTKLGLCCGSLLALVLF